MLEVKGLLKRAALVAIISALPGFVNVVSAGRGGSGGSGGSSSSSSSGGSSSSSGGHSSSGMSGAHASTSTNAGHSATNSKGGRSASDPSNVTQSGANHHVLLALTSHSSEASKSFVRMNHAVSIGETGQNIQGGMVPNEDWKRRHRHLPY